MAKQVSTSKTSNKKVEWNFPLTKQNFIIFGAGLVTIVIGYMLMATGITDDPQKHQEAWNNPLAVSVAPLVLVLGYCVIIPFAIIKLFPKKED
ncbi:MAG: DUF3098 domain-containing protein [Candidatus Kapabacteria bacterium]|nr:DUF3098 domain-containing protein [Candidatus Kapabacteria bacterium]MBX7153885.1 DUF3098 domain-containing protein [Bacteroidota bacterium]